jgi:hypothetical protein
MLSGDLINRDQLRGTGLPKFLANDLHTIYETTAIKIYVTRGSTLASSAIFSYHCFRFSWKSIAINLFLNLSLECGRCVSERDVSVTGLVGKQEIGIVTELNRAVILIMKYLHICCSVVLMDDVPF